MLRAGIKTFMTTKMSWNDTNSMPADTFRWRGIDGSDVLAHFITTPAGTSMYPLNKTDTYNGDLTVHRRRSYCTAISTSIQGCGEQLYDHVPALSNVTEADWPAAISPVSVLAQTSNSGAKVRVARAAMGGRPAN